MSHSARPTWRAPTALAADPRVLVLFCHPQAHRSRINRALLDAVTGLEGVTTHDLYERYPDASIEVAEEQDLLLKHHTIVLQHPFYWYSTPPLLKEWLDVVLQWGWAYGKGGTHLRGKRMLQAITTGGPPDAYHPEGHNRFTIKELLAPMNQTAWLCGMAYEEPFVVHGTHRISPSELEGFAAAYRERILSLRGPVTP